MIVFMPNAYELCSGAPACYFPTGHFMVIDREIKTEYLPFVFLHEYAHSIGITDENNDANKWVVKNFPDILFPADLEEIL